jgi:hypothetical protein
MTTATDLENGIWRLVHQATSGCPVSRALLYELARLYTAAAEPVPPGLACYAPLSAHELDCEGTVYVQSMTNEVLR